MIGSIIVIAILIGVYGKFMTNHISKVMEEQFKYHLGLVKKDTNLFQDTISFKDTYLKGNTELPILQLRVEGRICNLLLDTGANINILNESVFNEVNVNNKIELIKPKESIVVGSGPVDYLGTGVLNFSHQKIKFSDNFDIMNMDNAFNQIHKDTGVLIDGILGNNFFKTNQWSLDFDKLVVWVK